MIRVVRTWESSLEGLFEELGKRGRSEDGDIREQVRHIVEEVRRGGHDALLALARRFDGLPEGVSSLELPYSIWTQAQARLAPHERKALELAAARIREFHELQRPKSWLTVDQLGCILGQILRPLKRVGIYVPGGKAVYPSSVLMTAIPAKVAGVKEVVMCSPLAMEDPDPAVLAAASLAGVDRIFAVGGAHAIAAMAYGVGEVPKVDKIVGPGNVFVAEAKRQVFGEVGIDMIAGPSEIMVVADGSVPARFAAADMLSQAEHDELASAILITPSEEYASEVVKELHLQLVSAMRAEVARESLSRYGAVVICRDLDEALDIASRIAPEHLELLVERPLEVMGKVRNAGAVFLGPWSAESFGDYIAGPSHVLPTGRTSRFSSPLGVEDFLKRTSVVGIPRDAGESLAEQVATLARMEGLEAHQRSVQHRWRLKDS